MESIRLGGSEFTVWNLTKRRVKHRADEQREAAPWRGSRWEGWMELPVKEALSQKGRMGRAGVPSDFPCSEKTQNTYYPVLCHSTEVCLIKTYFLLWLKKMVLVIWIVAISSVFLVAWKKKIPLWQMLWTHFIKLNIYKDSAKWIIPSL